MTTNNNALTYRGEFPLLVAQAFGGFGLLLLITVQMRVFATLFDHDFMLLAIGGALFGVAAGLGLGHWLVSAEAQDHKARQAAGLMVAGLTASGGLVLLLSWPLGAVIPFMVTVAAFAAPFAGWGYGIAFVTRSPGARSIRGAWLVGAIAGLLLSGSLVEYIGNPLSLGWWTTIILGIGALLAAGSRITAGLVGGVLMVLASAAYFLSAGLPLAPSWSEAGLATARSLYGELRSDKLAAEPETLWSGSHRTDVLTYRGQDQDLRWLFTDATAPVPVVIGGDHGIDWLKERFPLLAIPLLASKPQRLLTVGAFPGPELDLARALGVRQARGLAYNGDAADSLRRAGWSPGGESMDVDVRYTDDPRGSLRVDQEGFDQIILPITHFNKQGWVGSNLQDRYQYTLEAFQDYWQRLRPGGLLVVTTADELLFVRTVLSIWAMLERHPTEAGGPSALRSWGLHLAPDAPFQGSHQYLLMVAKGSVAADLPVRLQQAIQSLPVEALFGPGLGSGQRRLGNLFGGSPQQHQTSPVEALFGPGFLANRHYAALFQLGGLAKAEEILTRTMSQQAGRWITVSPATDQRPVFFDVLPEQRPELKWLFTGMLVVLVGGVLFALPSTRRPDVAGVPRRPGVAVFLVYFALIGAAGAMMLVGMMGRSARLVGVSLETQAILLAAVLAGAAAALLFMRRQGFARLSITLPPLVAMILAALLYWVTGPAYAAVSGWPVPVRWLVAVGCGVLMGAVLAMLCDIALRHLSAIASAVVPWAWLVLGTAALSGVVLAEWWGAAWGWGRVWAALCGAYAVLLIAGYWIWRLRDEPNGLVNAEAAAAS